MQSQGIRSTSNPSGKTVLVTGASRGIGRATAVALAKADALVFVHCNGGGKDATAGNHLVTLRTDSLVAAVATTGPTAPARQPPDLYHTFFQG